MHRLLHDHDTDLLFFGVLGPGNLAPSPPVDCLFGQDRQFSVQKRLVEGNADLLCLGGTRPDLVGDFQAYPLVDKVVETAFPSGILQDLVVLEAWYLLEWEM